MGHATMRMIWIVWVGSRCSGYVLTSSPMMFPCAHEIPATIQIYVRLWLRHCAWQHLGIRTDVCYSHAKSVAITNICFLQRHRHRSLEWRLRWWHLDACRRRLRHVFRHAFLRRDRVNVSSSLLWCSCYWQKHQERSIILEHDSLILTGLPHLVDSITGSRN
jgi:hypothetical protein